MENPIYIFIDSDSKGDEQLFCRSFFTKTNRDYTAGNTKMAMLYKEKRNKLTGEVLVQFDKLRD